MKKQLLGMAVLVAYFFVWQANTLSAQEQPQGASGPQAWPKFDVVSIRSAGTPILRLLRVLPLAG